MTKVTLYGLKTCDTCRKAIKALSAAGHDVAVVDVRGEANLVQKLPTWLDTAGADRLINTRSTTWRGLDQAERSKAEENPVELLSSHPALIKRPVIEVGAEIHVGWTKPVQDHFGI